MEKLFLKGPLIADVLKGNTFVGNIYIEDGIIKEVREQMEAPEEAVVVDCTGKTVIPGMFNCHTHMSLGIDKFSPVDLAGFVPDESNDGGYMYTGVKQMALQLKGGVTFCRDVGGRNYLDIELRDACAKGAIQGPDLIVSGRTICMTGGHSWVIPGVPEESDGPNACRKAARRQLRAGVDCLKVIGTGGVMTRGVEPGSPQLGIDEMAAVVEEGNKAGVIVASHAQGNTGVKNSVKAGVHSIEHGIYLDEEAVRMMRAEGTVYVPTLCAIYFITKSEGHAPDYVIRKGKEGIDSHMRSFKLALDEGVEIAAGTDAGTPFNLHDMSAYELVLMVEAGATPMQALQIATINSARLCRVDSTLGSITPGKKAHLVVYDQNPLENIKEITNVAKTYKNGRLVYDGSLPMNSQFPPILF